MTTLEVKNSCKCGKKRFKAKHIIMMHCKSARLQRHSRLSLWKLRRVSRLCIHRQSSGIWHSLRRLVINLKFQAGVSGGILQRIEYYLTGGEPDHTCRKCHIKLGKNNPGCPAGLGPGRGSDHSPTCLQMMPCLWDILSLYIAVTASKT